MRRGLTQRRITGGHQRLGNGTLEKIIRALQLPGGQARGLHLHDLEGLRGQRRVQFVVRQQLHRPLKVCGRCLHREIGARGFLCGDLIQRRLESDTIQSRSAIFKQAVQHVVDAILILGLLQFRLVLDASVHAHGVAHIRGLHDQLDAVSQGDRSRMQRGFRQVQSSERLRGPLGQRHSFFRRTAKRLRATEALGGHRFAGAFRREDGTDGLTRIQVRLRHAVHVRHGYALERRPHVIRRLQTLECQRL